MTFQNLLKVGRLKAHEPNAAEVQRLLAAIRRNLADAAATNISAETRFDASYKAVMQCALVAMLAAGYRPVAKEPGHHQTVRVVSLPMLVVLKVLAWKDRHRFTRAKDAEDLQLILRRYLEAGNLDRLYTECPHLITDRFNFEPTGAWLLGRDARAALEKHSSRFDQALGALNAVMEPERDAEGRLTLVLQLAPNDPEEALDLLAAFNAGPAGAISP